MTLKVLPMTSKRLLSRLCPKSMIFTHQTNYYHHKIVNYARTYTITSYLGIEQHNYIYLGTEQHNSRVRVKTRGTLIAS